MRLARSRQLVQAALFALGVRRPLVGPAKLAWEVTDRCNSRCLTCVRREADPQELSTDEGLQLIRQASAVGVVSLSFSGGEPLLRADLETLVCEANRRGLHTSLSTNGLLLHQRMAGLVEAGLRTVYVSLDGTEETHDAIRGVPGGFRRATQAASALARVVGVRVFYNTTVCRRNLAELPLIASQAVRDGVHGLTLQPAQTVPSVALVPPSDLVLGPQDAPQLRATLRSLRARFPHLIPLPRPYLEEMPRFVEDPSYALGFRCVAGVLQGVVSSRGELFPCPVQFASMGNVRSASLASLWWGTTAADLRRRIALGNHPPCWFNCVVPASLVLRGLKGLVTSGGTRVWRHLIWRSGS